MLLLRASHGLPALRKLGRQGLPLSGRASVSCLSHKAKAVTADDRLDIQDLLYKFDACINKGELCCCSETWTTSVFPPGGVVLSVRSRL